VFGTSDIIVVKTLGCGAALAVLVDSLLVRCLLLPSLLSLLALREVDEPAPRMDLLPESGGGVW
jgi:MMPL family